LAQQRKQNFLSGAAVLAATVMIVKIIGAIYKIPLLNLLGDEGSAHFNAAYQIYNFLLAVSTAGIPAAISRLVSTSLAKGGRVQVRRYLRMGILLFTSIGVAGTTAMLLWPQFFADLIGDHEIANCIRVLAPAVTFSCVISVYRGYTQGHSNMIPTAISQILEVLGKLVIGLAVAWQLMRMGASSANVSAGAIVGVTAGLGAAVPVLVIYCAKMYRYAPENTGVPEAVFSRTQTVAQMLRVSIPITLSSSLASIISVIDTKVLYERLQNGAGFSFFDAKILYGVYSKGLTLFNLPSAFIVPLSVSVVPSIAAALAVGKRQEARGVMESSTRVMNLIAMPACAGMCVLAGPIFSVLFPDSHELGPLLLQILSFASYFLCLELMSSCFLQASGYERVLLLTSVTGSLVKVALDWWLAGDANVNILGAPISNIVCYLFISAANLTYIRIKTKESMRYGKVFLRPLLCTLIMAAAAWAVHGLCVKLFFTRLGGGALASAVCLFGAVGAAVVIYAVLVIGLKAITREDLLLLPKGEKIADKLKIR